MPAEAQPYHVNRGQKMAVNSSQMIRVKVGVSVTVRICVMVIVSIMVRTCN